MVEEQSKACRLRAGDRLRPAASQPVRPASRPTLSIQVPADTLSLHRAALRCPHGHQERAPRVLDEPPCKAHSRASRAPHLWHRSASRPGFAPRRGGAPRRGQRRLLHPSRARQRGRRLGHGAGGTRPCPAARRHRARPPLRPRTRDARRRAETQTPLPARRQTRGAAHDRRDDRRPRVRPQRPARHPRREPARSRPLLGAPRQPRAAAEHGPLRLPRRPLHELLQGLGPRRRRCRGGPARGGGARPVRPRALRPGRGTVRRWSSSPTPA